jgi:hypothetical protein
MIFMIWYRTKVLHVLKEAFQYKPTMLGWQSEIFNGVTRQIRSRVATSMMEQSASCWSWRAPYRTPLHRKLGPSLLGLKLRQRH